VKDLRGPFDFVFLDADKDGYVHYAKSLIPKLAPGGCITAHNVAEPRSSSWGGYEEGTAEFYKYMKGLPEFSTRIHPESRYGVSVSYKKKSN
jgi:predicted O-methyltransferase YrrM